MDPKKLYNYYETILNSDVIDIFVIGNVEDYYIKKIIGENFKNIKTLKKPTESHFYNPKPHKFFPKKIFESHHLKLSHDQ